MKKNDIKKIDIKKLNIKKFIEKIDLKKINTRKLNFNKVNIKKINIKKYILVIIAAIIFASDIYISANLNIASFEHCIYSLIKMEGSSSAPVLYAFIYISLVFIILLFILILPVYDFGKKVCLSIKDKVIKLYPISNIKMYGIILIVLSMFGLLYIVKFFPFVKSTIFSTTDLFDDYYVESSDVEILFPDEKRNLIYIFMESMEMTNVSVENGGVFEESIIPNLEKLAIDNINFSNDEDLGGAYQTFGVGWTVAAMIAHTSGTPLKMTFNDVNANSNRFMNVTSIGDILASNGYNNYLLLGSDSNFGGRKSFFSNHNYLINDYYTAVEDGRLEEDYFEWWGYEDSKLFSYAKDILLDISNDDEPFNLTMLTADTHFTDGYLDKSCDDLIGDNKYANSFYCSDRMVYEFIEWIKEQDFYDNTTIIIVGDHLTMQDGFYEEKDEDSRRIYNVFINAKVDGKYNDKNRIFTTMDMFPTTIAAIGGTIEGDRLGLGTNLFSDKKTIPEIIGIEEFDNELMKGSNYYYSYIRG